MRNGRKENTGSRFGKLHGINTIRLRLVSDQLWIGVRIIPEIKRIVNGNPGVIQLSEKTHARRNLCSIVLVEDLVGDIVHFDLVEWRPCWVGRNLVVG